ncbi:phage terminase large subunit-like protein [Neorhizobium galegae]|uniref:DNA-packaging protein n=1 Tax=Neorhizobium galegae TaxID=399 RepID=UPI001FD98F11|nr:terminase family protein [Neorhizobium galegae]MBP2547524.1 phage terminase large subunit-like protein [Neorhizobium galegae]
MTTFQEVWRQERAAEGAGRTFAQEMHGANLVAASPVATAGVPEEPEAQAVQAARGARAADGGSAKNACAVPAGPAVEAVAEVLYLPALVRRHALRVQRSWSVAGRTEQQPPQGDWRTWLIMGGRGSGKTRAGAEWVQSLASAGSRSELRIALVAETLGDAREVMIDGVSGICRIAGSKAPDFEISRRRLVWRNGAVAQIFSSEDPESLRGPQFHYAWCDELAKWKHAQETFDMLQFGLRLGQDPRQLVTTTPRPVPILKQLIADAGTRLVKISTRDNAENLAPGFLSALEGRYGGTRLGRQELDGDLIEDRDDALWKRAQLEALTQRVPAALGRIVVAVDPPSGMGAASCCGIVVAGLETAAVAEGGAGAKGSQRAVVLADCSVEGFSPSGWARAVVKVFHRFGADRVVAEVNQGGEMVAAMLKSIDEQLPLTQVRATRGKFLRAEPVAALYEQGRVLHAARFRELEDQMCDFGPDGLSSGRSPDRLDALVWALTALMLDGQGEPRVRGL